MTIKKSNDPKNKKNIYNLNAELNYFFPLIIATIAKHILSKQTP